MEGLEQILNTIISWLVTFGAAQPILGKVLVVMVFVQGLCRLIFKPLMAFFSKYVILTSNKSDDAIIRSVPYRVLAFLVDWFCSLKLPGAR